MKAITSHALAKNLLNGADKPVRLAVLGYTSDAFTTTEAFGRIVLTSKHTLMLNTIKKAKKPKTSEEAI